MTAESFTSRVPSLCSSVMVVGNLTVNSTWRSPNRDGSSGRGIPSPFIVMTKPRLRAVEIITRNWRHYCMSSLGTWFRDVVALQSDDVAVQVLESLLEADERLEK